MNKKEQINQLIDEAFNSVNNIKRASPMPFLLTRVNARLNKTTINAWEKVILFIGRPAFAIPGLILLILINVMAILFTRAATFTAATEQSAQADDYTYTLPSIYDFENIEP